MWRSAPVWVSRLVRINHLKGQGGVFCWNLHQVSELAGPHISTLYPGNATCTHVQTLFNESAVRTLRASELHLQIWVFTVLISNFNQNTKAVEWPLVNTQSKWALDRLLSGRLEFRLDISLLCDYTEMLRRPRFTQTSGFEQIAIFYLLFSWKSYKLPPLNFWFIQWHLCKYGFSTSLPKESHRYLCDWINKEKKRWASMPRTASCWLQQLTPWHMINIKSFPHC